MSALNMKLIFLCCFLFWSYGSCFLLPSTQSTPITDTHYNFLLDLLMEERQARKNLETYVTRDFTRLQEDVSKLKQQDFTRLQDDLAKLKQCGCASSVVQTGASSDNDNRTEALENDLRDTVNELQTLKTKYASLEVDFTRASAKTVELEKELNILKGLKIFADLSSVANLQNQTNTISLELKTTQEKQSTLVSDSNARKQDFIALYQKLQETEGSVLKTNENLVNVTEAMKSTISHINTTVFGVLKINVDSVEQKLESRINSLNTTLNADKPAFAASLTYSKSYSENEIVKFDKVWTNTGNGYNPATGKFTAPATGTYYFSCTIAKSGTYIRVFLMKNSSRTVSLYPGNDNLQVGTINIALFLNQGDQVYIQVHKNPGTIYSESTSHMTYFSGFMLQY